MINFAERISKATSDAAALQTYAKLAARCDATYEKAMRATQGSPTTAKRLTTQYNALVVQMPKVIDALAKRGILRKALHEHPLKY